VALLSPYRQKTETGVNALNEVLRDSVNPPALYKREASCGKRVFREGDKVMQTRNHDDISNGDIGMITSITQTQNDVTVRVDFGDGRVKEYDSADLEMLDHGYATTIHKSQGSEYRSVIINIQCAHSIMLTRPLIYTAITRGKDRVILVGERRALCIAIKKTDTEKRGTCLAHRLQALDQEFSTKGEAYGNRSFPVSGAAEKAAG
jgi:exodeoxyribonuclease V alpha subunit